MAKLFKGNDRKILLKASEVAAAIELRDARAADPKPTQKLSTRTRMFSSGVTLGSPPTTEAALLSQFVTLLADKLNETA